MIPEKYIGTFEDIERSKAVSILIRKEKMNKREAEAEYNKWRRDYIYNFNPLIIKEKAQINKAKLNKDEVIKMYVDKRMSLYQIASVTGYSYKTISKYLKRWGIQIRPCYSQRLISMGYRS